MHLDKQQACQECDLLITLPNALEKSDSLSCPRCHSVQFTSYENALEHLIAFSTTALIFLVIANSFPFLSFDAQGQMRTISMFESSYQLYQEGFFMLSVLVYSFVILLPTLYLLCVLAIVLPVKFNRKPFGAIRLAKIIGLLEPWTMAEVFVVGVLVAIIKVVEIADIVFGVAFWAYLVFVLFFTAAYNITNKQQLWHWVEHGK